MKPRGDRGDIPEERNERITLKTKIITAGEVHAVRRCMGVEADKGLGWIGVGMLGKDRLSTLAAAAPGGIIQADARGEIGPAVPGPVHDFVEVLQVTNDVSASPLVTPVLGGIEPALRVEGDAIGVAQAPRDQLQVAAIRVAAENAPVASHVSLDHLPRFGLLAKGNVGS